MKFRIVLLLGITLLTIFIVFTLLSGGAEDPTEEAPGSSTVRLPDTDETVTLPEGYSPSQNTVFPTLLTRPADPTLQSVLDYIYPNHFAVTPCRATDELEQVLTLQFKYSFELDPQGEAQTLALRSWESDVLQDMGHLIFPNVSDPQALPLLTFQTQGEFRVAETSVGGTARTVAYDILNNAIYLASTPACIEAVQLEIYGYEH